MRLNDLTHERKPKTGSAKMPRGRTIQLMKRLKDLLQTIGWNADAGIGDRDNDQVVSLFFESDNNGSTRRGELDPVIEELTHHPTDLLRIRLHMGEVFSG